MPLKHRALVVLAVVSLHLILLSSLDHDRHVKTEHPPMTVSIMLPAATPMASTLASAPAQVAPRPPQKSPQAIRPSLDVPPAIMPESPPASQREVLLTTSQSEVPPATDKTVLLPDREPDYQATYLNNPAPIYPMVARRMSWQGKVIIGVKVLKNGSTGEVKLQQSSGHAVLDEAALKAVKSWQFSPARQAGQLVDKWFLIPIPFVLKEIE